MYTYRDAKEGKLPEYDSPIYIHGLKYELWGTNIFFANMEGGVNAHIFRMLGWEDPNELFESTFGNGNYVKATGDASPYAKTLENAREILIKLWETPRYKVNQFVKLGALHEGYSFRVYCHENMEKYSRKIAKIKSFKIHETSNEEQHKTGHNLLYKIEIDGKEVSWWFSEDMFVGEVSDIEMSINNAEASIDKLSTYEPQPKLDSNHIHIPKFLWDIISPKKDSVNTHSYTSIQLPKQSKNLKITL